MINLVIPTLIMSAISTVIAIAALAMVIGMKLSTHKIEWKPLDFDPIKEDEEDQIKEEEDAAELLDKALNLSKQASKKKKLSDPLDEILETNNF